MTAAAAEQERLLRDDRAFAAFLAALVDAGCSEIAGPTAAVHRSFAESLEQLREDPGIGTHFMHYYPSRSTGRVEELDKALIRGEFSGFVHYGNPTYSRIRVSLSPGEVQELLEEFRESEAVLKQAAQAFKKRLAAEVW